MGVSIFARLKSLKGKILEPELFGFSGKPKLIKLFEGFLLFFFETSFKGFNFKDIFLLNMSIEVRTNVIEVKAGDVFFISLD